MQQFLELIMGLFDVVNKSPVVGFMLIAIVAMAWFIEKRTVPMMFFQNKLEQIDQMHTDIEKVEAALGKVYEVQERQIVMHEQMFRRLDEHTTALNNLSQDIKLISYEVNGRRIESGR